ncbi:MAG: nickel pincer cofactor biosynthesis protein LarB [bacterium]|nr:nickel pincer cofactor biosynthesis protein LarB [bacterium]
MIDILSKLEDGEITKEKAEGMIKDICFNTTRLKMIDNLARIDLCRESRSSIPEVVYVEGKKPEIAANALFELAKERGRAMGTRINSNFIEHVKKTVPLGYSVKIYDDARIAIVWKEGHEMNETGGRIGIIAAGTSDTPIAEEAKVTAMEMGCRVFTAYDVGVAGIHRLFNPLEKMLKQDVHILIVVAGMEGTLPTIVKSLVNLPVVAVPTSVGYGVGKDGFAAMCTMLQSCSPGIAVVNIDNGFGAGVFSSLIARKIAKNE